ncbi:hypothetical protein DACRYDRAFT_25571 [Dacryopinax primogenitus]|uniref:Uncharacterized protein n=1 Tax=Dacryopinax primogenitus (strain DJM 731) TaxID=1858805 RepID=M5FTR4_DACPD|nr:uncharacterized protein DACRYDRAFT_25571 [Dacryopinax primogenitus]EJT96621.1 hypothetical protein DACRYDRAFT_25571 [Dacryopinax primogenitus]
MASLVQIRCSDTDNLLGLTPDWTDLPTEGHTAPSLNVNTNTDETVDTIEFTSNRVSPTDITAPSPDVDTRAEDTIETTESAGHVTTNIDAFLDILKDKGVNIDALRDVLKDNATLLRWLGGGVAVGSVVVCATPLLLPVVGFGAAGVTSGSLAAGIQAALYGSTVPAGSLFALAQSFGAGGALGAQAVAAVQAGGAVTGAISAGVGALGAYLKR